MPSTVFDARRAVEIFPNSSDYGTGYRIADRLVLTAKHVFENAKTNVCEVRCHKKNDNYYAEKKFLAEKVWESEDHDIALIEIKVDEAWCAEDISTVFAAIDNTLKKQLTAFEMFVYPKALQSEKDGKIIQGGQRSTGEIDKDDTAGDNTIPIRPDDNFISFYESQSGWQGGSGAAIFCSNKCVAILKHKINEGQNKRLNAESLHHVFDDSKWQEILERHKLGFKYQAILELIPSEQAIATFEAELTGNLSKAVFTPITNALAKTMDIALEGRAVNVEHLAKQLCKKMLAEGVISTLEDILKPSIETLKEDASDSLKSNVICDGYYKLLGLMLPFAFEKMLHELQLEHHDESCAIMSFPVREALGVEVIYARFKRGLVSIELTSRVPEGALALEKDYTTEEGINTKELLKDIWNKVIPDEDPAGIDELTDLDKVDLLEALKLEFSDYKRSFYGIYNKPLEGGDFIALSKALYEAFDFEAVHEFRECFAMIQYGGQMALTPLTTTERRLQRQLSYFHKALQDHFPS